MNIETRQRIEKEIVQAAATGLIDAGYKVAVFDGEEVAQKQTDSIESIVNAMFSTDEDTFYVYPANGGECVGFVLFIYGNDGWDVINDYSMILEDALDKATQIAESYS